VILANEAGGGRSLQNTGTYPPDYKASYLQRSLSVSAGFISAAATSAKLLY
jgi:hypothetical protein